MSGVPNSKAKYHDPYANLAAAILESGTKCNDTRFLESEWACLLRDMCSLDDEMYSDRSAKLLMPTSRLGGKIDSN